MGPALTETERMLPDGEPDPGLPIPLGRRIELPGRGTTFVREVEGPPGAPTVVLLHGWIASGGLNWFQAFEPLGRHFHVVAPDHRGHGRGIRSHRRFRLADCADDVAVLMDQLGISSAIMVGYSMGGPIAELLWKRHRSKTAALVLCATSHAFVPVMRERLVFTSFMAAMAGTSRAGQLAAMLPSSVARQFAPAAYKGRPDSIRRWAAAEMRRHDYRMIMEAGMANGHFNSSKWIEQVDVPTVVMITTKDRALAPTQQARLALAIPQASIKKVDGGHMVCADPAFGPAVVEACLDVGAQAYPAWNPHRRRTDP